MKYGWIALPIILVAAVALYKWAPHKKKVIITTSSNRNAYFLGEPIPVDVKIKNISQDTFSMFYFWRGAGTPYLMDVWDENNQEFSWTDEGKRYEERLRNPPRAFGGSQPIDHDLKPGDVKSDRIVVSEFFQVTRVHWEDKDTMDIYVSISRYGETAEPLKLTLLKRSYDVSDPLIQEAFAKGEYHGVKLKR